MNRLNEFLSNLIGIESWGIALIAIALVTFALNQVVATLLRHAVKASARTSTIWDETLFATAGRPLQTAIWLVVLGFMARMLQRQVETQFIEHVLLARDVGLITCVAWFVMRFVRKGRQAFVASRAANGEEVDQTTVDALGKLAVLVTLIVAAVTIAQTLGFPISGLLALGGIGGIAVGFAAQGLVSNFFGGLTIYLDRPFGVGDWIRSPDKSIEGTVEYISWRHTRVRAFNKNPIYVPNSVFTTIVVENPSRMSHRRIKETIGLRYDDFAVVAPIVADIKEMLREHPGIDSTQTLIVNFNQFAASSLDILIYAFTKTTVWVEYHAVKQDVLLRIGEIIAGHGAEIAFPTQTLHVRGGDAAERAPEEAQRADGAE